MCEAYDREILRTLGRIEAVLLEIAAGTKPAGPARPDKKDVEDAMWMLEAAAKLAPVEVWRIGSGKFCASPHEVEASHPPMLRSCVGFGDTPVEAINAMWAEMATNTLVKNAMRDDRTKHRWNGKDWETVA